MNEPSGECILILLMWPIRGLTSCFVYSVQRPGGDDAEGPHTRRGRGAQGGAQRVRHVLSRGDRGGHPKTERRAAVRALPRVLRRYVNFNHLIRAIRMTSYFVYRNSASGSSVDR